MNDQWQGCAQGGQDRDGGGHWIRTGCKYNIEDTDI